MNQIPNIEEEPLPSIDELLKQYFDTPTGGAAEYVDIADIRSLIYRAREEEKQTHHQQLQKARNQERERIAKILLADENKIVQTVGKALIDHSELDQDKPQITHECHADVVLTSMPPQWKCTKCGRIEKKPF